MNNNSIQHTETKPYKIQQITDEQFNKLESDVFTYWPTATHLPHNYKSLTVFSHAEQLVRTNPVQATIKRRDEFRTFLSKKVEKLLGKEVAKSVYDQLDTNHSIATAQHHSPLSPNTLNTTLTMSLAYANRNEPDRKNLIVLACSGISFNNHWYPRGHLFHSQVNDVISVNQVNFYGRAADADPVITARGYTQQIQKNMMKVLLHYRSEKMIKKRELNKIIQILEEIYFTKDILSQPNYIDQLTISNFYGWKKLFSSYEGTMPNLIFLSQEKVAAELLREFHINSDTILHQVLFNSEWHKMIYKYFNNIMCAFSVERKYGTFLFWATPKNTNSRIQLFAKNGALISSDEKISIPLTPESIYKALLNEEIAPSTMLTFLVLSLYYGYSLIGGLDQPTYLSETKEAYLKMLAELELNEEVENCTPIISNDILFTRPTLAFLDGPFDQRSQASLLDLLVHGQPNSWQKIVNTSKQITVQDILYRLYPELYRDYCKHEKDETLLTITERDIERYTKTDVKIPPWATLTNF